MPHSLSGGEAKRVAIVRTLLTKPDILLMDEPLSGIDEERKQAFIPYLHSLCAFTKIPIVYVTHHVDEILQLADSVMIMKNGSIVEQGTLSSLSQSPFFKAITPSNDQGVSFPF